MDVFSHAVESLTARPFTHRPAPEDPTSRPVIQGANPFSDLNCLEVIRLIGENLVEAVDNAARPITKEEMRSIFAGALSYW